MPEPIVKNAANEEQVKESGKKSDRARERELDDVRHVLSTIQGRRFIWRYLDLIDRTSFHPSGSQVYFNEGERNVCLRIKADVAEASLESLFTMMKESKGYKDV